MWESHCLLICVSLSGAERPKLLCELQELYQTGVRGRTELSCCSSAALTTSALCTPTVQTLEQPSHSCRSQQHPQAAALKHRTLPSACLHAPLLSCLSLPDATWLPTFPSMCSSTWHHPSYLNCGDSVVYFKNSGEWWICISLEKVIIVHS